MASVPPKPSVKRPMCPYLPVHFQSQSDRLHGSDIIIRHINYPICKSKENAWHDCVSPNALLHVSLRTGYKIRPSLRPHSSPNLLNNITKISMYLGDGVPLAFWALPKICAVATDESSQSSRFSKTYPK